MTKLELTLKNAKYSEIADETLWNALWLSENKINVDLSVRYDLSFETMPQDLS